MASPLGKNGPTSRPSQGAGPDRPPPAKPLEFRKADGTSLLGADGKLAVATPEKPWPPRDLPNRRNTLDAIMNPSGPIPVIEGPARPLPPRVVPDSPEMVPSSSQGREIKPLSLDEHGSPVSKGPEPVKDETRSLKAPERPGPTRQSQIVPEPTKAAHRVEPRLPRGQQQLPSRDLAALNELKRAGGPARRPPQTPDALVRGSPDALPTRVMGDAELLNKIVAMRLAQQDPSVQASLSLMAAQLKSHTFDFVNMAIEDVAKLFVALGELPDLQADGVRGDACAALRQRLATMQPETFLCLANLPNGGEDAGVAELHSAFRDAMPDFQNQLMVKSVNQAIKGVQEKSAATVSLAVETAMLVHAAIVQMDPASAVMSPVEKKSAFEAALVAGFGKLKAGDASGLASVFKGQVLGFDEAARGGAPRSRPNSVSIALGREPDGTNSLRNRETTHVRILYGAMAKAVRPDWVEPQAPGRTTATLFGDGSVPPSTAIAKIRGVKVTGDYVTFLSTLHELKGLPSLTQKEAERRMAPLRAIAENPEYAQRRQQHGGMSEPILDWNLDALKDSSPKDRPGKLHALLTPARVEIERRVVLEVNSEVARIAQRKVEEVAVRNRMRNQEPVKLALFLAAPDATPEEANKLSGQEVQTLLISAQPDARNFLHALSQPGGENVLERSETSMNAALARVGAVHPGLEIAACKSLLRRSAGQIEDLGQCEATLAALSAMDVPERRPTILRDPKIYEQTLSSLRVRRNQLKVA
jgi:hypothetical protein